MLPVVFRKGKEVRLIALVWFLNQANRDPFKTQPFCFLGMPWSLMSHSPRLKMDMAERNLTHTAVYP